MLDAVDVLNVILNERIVKLEEENKRYREALKEITNADDCLRLIAKQALEEK